MSLTADRFFMELALELARQGLGRTSPNPAVGCVIAKGGRVIGRGFHEAAGKPHAEAVALTDAAKAGESVQGADVYVTLEPCAHHGRTPPCAEALVAAGVARVVAAMEDPNPEVAGSGLDILRSATIAVDVGVCSDEARRLNEGFCLSIVQQRAFVHLKLAATLDGRIATRTGDSRWVTSEVSRLEAHKLRDRCGAILVGIETALTDDPKLTVRLPNQPERHIVRVILDRTLRAPPVLAMLQPGEAEHTALVCGEGVKSSHLRRMESTGAKVIVVPVNENGRLDLKAVLEILYRLGIMEVLVEGGGTTARGFLDAGLVDRCHLYYTPRILGGSDSVPMVGGEGPNRMDEAVPLEELEVASMGPDIYITGIPKRG